MDAQATLSILGIILSLGVLVSVRIGRKPRQTRRVQYYVSIGNEMHPFGDVIEVPKELRTGQHESLRAGGLDQMRTSPSDTRTHGSHNHNANLSSR